MSSPPGEPPGADEPRQGDVRVFIYGSCVSRDTFEVMDRRRFTLVKYVARQSLISAFGTPGASRPLPSTLSQFQRRMLDADIRSSLPSALTAARGLVDVLLWDLTDERLGVYELPGGSYVTRTPEIIGTGLEQELTEVGRLVHFGTDEHMNLWAEAANRWLELLRTTGLADRVLVLAPSWAERLPDGGPAPSSFGLTADEANDAYGWYYDLVDAAGIPVIRTPPESTIASADHRWGPAPFHYDDGTYRSLMKAVEEFVRRTPVSSGTPQHAHAAPDYSRWLRYGGPPVLWQSVPEFVSGARHRDGLHRVTTATGVVELLLTGSPLHPDTPWNRIPVFFSGAVTNRDGAPGPHFSGLSMALELGIPAVLVADTTLTQHRDLGLAWYAGCDSTHMQQDLVDVLGALSVIGPRPLLLVGGSGGGFAALALSARLGPSAAVFCWNPQTDLLSYDPRAVRSYLASCFPHLAGDPATEAGRRSLRAALARRGLRTVAWTGASTDACVLYLQNASDWHVDRHLRPYVDGLGLSPDQHGWRSEHTTVLLGNWGVGHAVPPRDMIARAVVSLCRGDNPADVADELMGAFAAEFSQAEAADFLSAPAFDVRRDEIDGTVTVRPSASDEATTWLSFAYYVMAGSERLSTQWYGRSTECRIADYDLLTATSVTCFVRDVHGNTKRTSVRLS